MVIIFVGTAGAPANSLDWGWTSWYLPQHCMDARVWAQPHLLAQGREVMTWGYHPWPVRR